MNVNVSIKNPLLFLLALFGIFLGAGAFTFHEGEGLSYLGNEPKTCVNCHIMREHYDGWQKASHHAHATCNDCHLPSHPVGKYLVKGENGFNHSKAFTLQDFHEPIMIRPVSAHIVQANCVRCHAALVDQMLARAPDRAHDFSCAHCHSQVGHGPIR